MTDVVVTVPAKEWEAWVLEGELAPTGLELGAGNPMHPDLDFGFKVPRRPAQLVRGDRVYIVAHGRLRGYAPLVAVEMGMTAKWGFQGGWMLVRKGGAVACTIVSPISGFRGFRYRWWDRAQERDYPDWMIDRVPEPREEESE